MLATFCLGGAEATVTKLAEVTALAPDMNFAATLPREETTGLICVGITKTPFQGPPRIPVTGCIMGQR